jgi:hypothetical protein
MNVIFKMYRTDTVIAKRLSMKHVPCKGDQVRILSRKYIVTEIIYEIYNTHDEKYDVIVYLSVVFDTFECDDTTASWREMLGYFNNEYTLEGIASGRIVSVEVKGFGTARAITETAKAVAHQMLKENAVRKSDQDNSNKNKK